MDDLNVSCEIETAGGTVGLGELVGNGAIVNVNLPSQWKPIVLPSAEWHELGNIISAWSSPEMSSLTPTRLKIALQIRTHEQLRRVGSGN